MLLRLVIRRSCSKTMYKGIECILCAHASSISFHVAHDNIHIIRDVANMQELFRGRSVYWLCYHSLLLFGVIWYFSNRMRSTRQKMRLLRGISRSHTTGGSSLNVRKSSGSNNHNGNSNQHNFQQQHQANGNGSIANGNRTATTSAENNQNLAFSQSNGQVFNGNGNHSSGSAEGRTGRQRPQQKSQQQSVARSGAIRSLSTSSFSSISSSSSSSSSSTRKSTQNQNGHQSSPDHSSPDLLVANPAAHGIGHLFENGITLNNSFLSAASSSFGIGHPSRQWTQFLATNMDSTGLNSDIREKAFGICRDYLHGAWKQIDSKDLVIKRVR